MTDQDEPLDEEEFDMAATRPPMTLGLPHTLSMTLLAAGILFFLAYSTGNQVNDLVADVVALLGLGMIWSMAKVLLRTDFHGWDNFVAWVRLDARCLDTADWGGARLASAPLRSPYRSEASDHAA